MELKGGWSWDVRVWGLCRLTVRILEQFFDGPAHAEGRNLDGPLKSGRSFAQVPVIVVMFTYAWRTAIAYHIGSKSGSLKTP